MTRRPAIALRLLLAATAIGAATLAAALLSPHLAPVNLMMLFLLAVVACATTLGQGPAVFSALLAVAIFDFFFVPPHLTFAVGDTQYVVTFAVMLVVGLLVSTLAARVKDTAEMALQRERRTQALYALSRETSGLRDPRDVAAAGARHVRAALGADAPRAATALNNLALVVHLRGDYAEAGRLFEELIPLRRRILGGAVPLSKRKGGRQHEFSSGEI